MVANGIKRKPTAANDTKNQRRGGHSGTTPPKSSTETKRNPSKRHKRGSLLWYGLALSLWFFMALGVGLLWFAWDLPDPAAYQQAVTRIPQQIIYDRNGKEWARRGGVMGVPIVLTKLPSYVPAAFVATEDKRFFYHIGVDPIGLARAAWQNWQGKRGQQGGSTITQQLAKNLFLTPERSLSRKIKEMLLAFWLEYKFTKAELLEIYLSRVYFGQSFYGLSSAAKGYFKVEANQLSLAQVAILAGLPKAPSFYNPIASLQRASERGSLVVNLMQDQGLIKEADAKQALLELRNLPIKQAKSKGSSQKIFDKDQALTDLIIDSSKAILSESIEGDIKVYAELDSNWQNRVNNLAWQYYGQLTKDKIDQMAVVVMDGNGNILAMFGGFAEQAGGLNRAVYSQRQAGSIFKLFVYLAAAEAGWHEGDQIADEPIKIGDWQPDNFNGKSEGLISVKQAFAHSANQASVRLAMQIGLDPIITMARRLGITASLSHTPSLSLGAADVSLLEMTAAYASVANNGFAVSPKVLKAIKVGNKAYYQNEQPLAAQVVRNNPSVAEEAVIMLQHLQEEVVREGTGKAAGLINNSDFTYGGKTGTSQRQRDGWFIGYRQASQASQANGDSGASGASLSLQVSPTIDPNKPEPSQTIVVGVWMGNDDGSPSAHLTGGNWPARFFGDLMRSSQNLSK